MPRNYKIVIDLGSIEIALEKTTWAIFKYCTNTIFQIMEIGLSLQEAMPALINHAQTKKIAEEILYLFRHDVVPVIAINAVNNGIQNYYRSSSYQWLLASLSLTNYLVMAYTMRQGAQAFLRMLVLNIYGPAAFNAAKTIRSKTFCANKKCNTLRKMKGWIREPIILAANDALICGVNLIPIIGPISSHILGLFFNGRYITRIVTPERCERHKAMMQESVLALGLCYEGTCMVVDMLFERTIGLPPFLYHKILKQILLLLYINAAAHMEVPLLKPDERKCWFDPLNFYERTTRFMVDVIFSGLINRVPLDFAVPADVKFPITVSTILQFITKLLKNDLIDKPKILAQKNLIKRYLLPPMLRSMDDFINDPIMRKHWPTLRAGAISAIDSLYAFGQSDAATTLTLSPKTVALILYWHFGISKKITYNLLKLIKEADFWDLIVALKAWFERHNIKYEVKLIDKPHLALNGVKKIEYSLDQYSREVEKAEAIMPQPHNDKIRTTIPAEELISTRSARVTSNPALLFTTRQRKIINNMECARNNSYN